MNDSQKTILVGVGGGIAAYKTLGLVSALRKQGHRVQVAMTPAAQKFVTPLSFAAVSGHPVLDNLWPDGHADDAEGHYPHLYPATRTDAFILAPATANQIAKLAHGLADDVVSCSALSLATGCLRMFAPAMNVEMWNNPVVQQNVALLEQRGWIRLGPESGSLACGMQGPGRMMEPEQILAQLHTVWTASNAWTGKRVLILSGPTREHLDPIRYLGNPSSGKMGRQLAEQALRQGADVHFITGPVATSELPVHARCHVQQVVSAEDMLNAAKEAFPDAEVILYVAAVADYRPAHRSEEKLPKTEGSLTVELVSTPDIAATLCANKRPEQTAIGFALQTHDGPAQAQRKLERKNLDGIVLNYPDSLNSPTGHFTLITRTGPARDWGRLSKEECALRILESAREIHDSKSAS